MRPALMIFLLLTGMQSVMAYEEPEYKVLSETADYEVREYAPHVVAEVDVDGRMNDGGNDAFRILAGYIFGDNVQQEEMSMTAPVEARQADGSKHTYAFMMEKAYSLDALPEPLDERIRLTKRAPRIMAVRKYSGSWREANYRNNAAALLEALEADNRDYTGSVILARYNSPFTPWFLRRNEVMVELVP